MGIAHRAAGWCTVNTNFTATDNPFLISTEHRSLPVCSLPAVYIVDAPVYFVDTRPAVR
jgi:hypothetical protein